MSDLFCAAACQTDFSGATDRDGIGSLVGRLCAMVEQTITGNEPFLDARLPAIPGFARAVPGNQTASELHARLAVPIPNGHTTSYEHLAYNSACLIQAGSFLERDNDHPGCVSDTTVLIGPNGILSKYRKVNPRIPAAVHSSPHDLETCPDDLSQVTEVEPG